MLAHTTLVATLVALGSRVAALPTARKHQDGCSPQLSSEEIYNIFYANDHSSAVNFNNITVTMEQASSESNLAMEWSIQPAGKGYTLSPNAGQDADLCIVDAGNHGRTEALNAGFCRTQDAIFEMVCETCDSGSAAGCTIATSTQRELCVTAKGSGMEMPLSKCDKKGYSFQYFDFELASTASSSSSAASVPSAAASSSAVASSTILASSSAASATSSNAAHSTSSMIANSTSTASATSYSETALSRRAHGSGNETSSSAALSSATSSSSIGVSSSASSTRSAASSSSAGLTSSAALSESSATPTAHEHEHEHGHGKANSGKGKGNGGPNGDMDEHHGKGHSDKGPKKHSEDSEDREDGDAEDREDEDEDDEDSESD